jgi:hypothetical protein
MHPAPQQASSSTVAVAVATSDGANNVRIGHCFMVLGFQMLRRFIERNTQRQIPELGGEGQDGTRNVRATKSFEAKELSQFAACCEACDDLASTSTSSGRVDPKTGLVDCSVLVSANGELLIIPRELQTKDAAVRKNDRTKSKSYLDRTSTDFGEEYQSAIFMGNDLNFEGDKAMNGFSTKGWSIPATTLAIKQSADSMADFAHFAEQLVRAKKICAAQEYQMAKKLHPLIHVSEVESSRAEKYQNLLKESFPEHPLHLLPHRVGPLSFEQGSVHATLIALEHYYSHVAESETTRWKAVTDPSGPLTKLRNGKEQTEQREQKRRTALQEMLQKKKAKEDRLASNKEDAARRWNEVHDTEERVTKVLEEKIMDRNRAKEQKRMERLKQDEKKRLQDAAVDGKPGTTSSEIWDIVSAVTANMEEGSFEPMDLPQMELSAPTDHSRDSADGNVSDSTEDDISISLPITSRPDLEYEHGLPELRVAALEADDAVEETANTLLAFLSDWDLTVRSSKLAAETCLIGACNVQAKCLRTVIEMERQALEERMNQLDQLEAVAYYMDVRADLDSYINLDKTKQGGGSFLGEEDDGGAAAAFTILEDHGNGTFGMERTSGMHESMSSSGSNDEQMMTHENLDEAVDIFFAKNPLLGPDADDGDDTNKARDEFEESVSHLCKIGQNTSSSGRVHRSTICYGLNAKRNHEDEIPTMIQFEALCRLFSAVLSGCSPTGSGASLAKTLMNLSQTFFACDAGTDKKEIYVKSRLINHPLWSNDELW